MRFLLPYPNARALGLYRLRLCQQELALFSAVMKFYYKAGYMRPNMAAIGFGISGFLSNPSGSYVVFQPAPGATVTLASLTMGNVANLAFSGINIQSTGKFPLLTVGPGLGGILYLTA